MIDNFCVIRGRVTDVYFGWVNKGDGDKVPFLRLMVSAKRNSLQHSDPHQFTHDLLRVVAYGELARKTYAALSVSQIVVVVGWLQCRRPFKSQPAVLEVVAWQIAQTGQVELSIPPQLTAQIQLLAAQYHLEPNDLVSTLLMPQVEALKVSSPGDSFGEGTSETWKSESLVKPS